MNLIPIEHNVSIVAERLLASAILYENAGAATKANNLKAEALLIICDENNIEIIYSDSDNRPNMNKGKYYTSEWEPYQIDEFEGDIPEDILLKMANIPQKKNLTILDKTRALDPILIYNTMIQDPNNCRAYMCIKLAEWE